MPKNSSLVLKKNNAKKSKHLQDMSVDDFMNSLGDSASGSGSEDEREEQSRNRTENGTSLINSGSDEDSEDYTSEDESEEADVSAIENGSNDIDSLSDNSMVEDEDEEQHKKSLNKLKDLDPEFYQYLQENDKKLLQFGVSDSEEAESDVDKADEDNEDGVHQPPGKLEVNSDESDFEPEDTEKEISTKTKGLITLKMISQWRESLQNEKKVQTISDVVQAFHAALQRVAPEEERSACMFKVEGGAVFNSVVQMCVLDLLPALRRYLNLPSGFLSHTNPVKCKHWTKIKTLVRSYCADLLQLLGGVASVSISTVVLKHLHQMTPFVVCFPNVTKHFLKKMISLWATGEETVQVLAFLCILRATTIQQKTLLDQVLRHMYIAYIQNTKFVSPTTLPGINFMRRSLTEIFLLDENVSYHHAFLYIRQLAIHLRNAITVQKKESIQAVCNWQFISSLALWIEVLGASSKHALQPLLFPIVQVTIGAIKLVPTAQYYPLRFYCVHLLVDLSRSSGSFVPVLPFLLEVLNSYDFNKKHSKVSMKPLDFSCILRLSKAQQLENGFKDAVIESIYSLALEYLANESHSIAFPDLALPATLQMRAFLKKCKISKYTRKIKQILDKIEENSKFIENERKSATFKLSDTKAVGDWETAVKVKGTPIGIFFNNWKKMHNTKQTKLKMDAIDVSENLPKIVQPSKKKSKPVGPVDLLPSDDSDSDGPGFSDEELTSVKKRGKRGKRIKGKSISKKLKVSTNVIDDGGDDLVEDINLGEW